MKVAVFLLVVITLFFLIQSEARVSRRTEELRRKKKFDLGGAIKKGVAAAKGAVVKVAEKALGNLEDLAKKVGINPDKIKEELKAKAKQAIDQLIAKAKSYLPQLLDKVDEKLGKSLVLKAGKPTLVDGNIVKGGLTLDKSDIVVLSVSTEWTEEYQKAAVEFANKNPLHLFGHALVKVPGAPPPAEGDKKIADLCIPNLFVIDAEKFAIFREGDFTKLPSLKCLVGVAKAAIGDIPALSKVASMAAKFGIGA
jgi:hypothetical protein